MDLSGIVHVGDSQDAGAFDDIVRGRQGMWPRADNDPGDSDFFARGEFVVINDMQAERKAQEARRQEARLEQKRLLKEAQLRASKGRKLPKLSAIRPLPDKRARASELAELSEVEQQLQNLRNTPRPPPVIVVPAAHRNDGEKDNGDQGLEHELAMDIRNSPKVSEADIGEFVLENGTQEGTHERQGAKMQHNNALRVEKSRVKIHRTGSVDIMMGEGSAQSTITHVDRHSNVTSVRQNRIVHPEATKAHQSRFSMILQEIQDDGEGLSNGLPSLSAGSAANGVGGVNTTEKVTAGDSKTTRGEVVEGAEDLLEISENLTKLADELQRASAQSPNRPSRKAHLCRW